VEKQVAQERAERGIDKPEPPPLDLAPQTPDEIKAQEAERQRKADEAREEEKKAKADEASEDFVLSGSNRPVDEAEARGQGNLFDRPAAPEAGPSVERLESVGLVREFGDRWQYKFDVGGNWMTANSKEDAIERAAETYRKTPPESLLTAEERAAKADSDELEQLTHQYGHLSLDALRKKLKIADATTRPAAREPSRAYPLLVGNLVAAALNLAAAAGAPAPLTGAAVEKL
jgi:hypothetical protein